MAAPQVLDKKHEILQDEAINELSNIIDEEIKEIEENSMKKKQFEELEAMGETELIAKERHLEILGEIQKLSTNQLKHRTADHNANVKFGDELKDIRKYQNKFILIVMLLIAICFTGFGMVLHANKKDILPYANMIFNGVKTVSNVAKVGD